MSRRTVTVALATVADVRRRTDVSSKARVVTSDTVPSTYLMALGDYIPDTSRPTGTRSVRLSFKNVACSGSRVRTPTRFTDAYVHLRTPRIRRAEKDCSARGRTTSETDPMRQYLPRESWRATEHLRTMSQAFNVARAPRALRASLRLRPRASPARPATASGPLSEGPFAARPPCSLSVAALAR